MKIVVTSTGSDIDSQVDPRFGRCAYFLLIDTETMGIEAVENPSVALGSGVGIQSAQLMSEKGAQVVITGNCGPNAFQALNAAGIQVILGVNGSVWEVVEQYKNGLILNASGPSVQSHFGMSTQDFQSRGEGQGIGLGRGGGRGMGRGMGRRLGKGQGMGAGLRGVGAQISYQEEVGMPVQKSDKIGKEHELEDLKLQAKAMEEQLKTMQNRINLLEKEKKTTDFFAVVDSKACTACGTCQEVCPAGAISIDKIAHIAREKCTGCGNCISECSENALSLKKLEVVNRYTVLKTPRASISELKRLNEGEMIRLKRKKAASR